MRLLAVIFLLATLASSDHISRKILNYVLLSQFSNPFNRQKLIVLPVFLPVPVGLTKRILQRNSMQHRDPLFPLLFPQRNKAEIFIQSNGDCKNIHNCGISAVLT
ncbi:hypothetical protein JTE90_000909 [Oedothorax gibbosus]|uniref:Secreted protein n=1 Tax=Oedothorax gibbosus TaxID=931172 RepID=A0AAV6VUQ1_9ARAC|nr:hypothetical protein JTE90_000909 [Oedothorax gibbosus]